MVNQSKLQFHLGCGKRNFGPDWIHLDGCGSSMWQSKEYEHIQGNTIYPLTYYYRKSVYPMDENLITNKVIWCPDTKTYISDNSADLIYASHVLEYFDRQEAEKVLKDWFSKLKSGGLLRLAVPDFDAMARLYLAWKNKVDLDLILGPLYGRMEMSGKTIYHKTVYDLPSLTKILKKVGFSKVKPYNWSITPPHDKIDDHSQAYLPHMDKENGTLISLNVEAVK